MDMNTVDLIFSDTQNNLTNNFKINKLCRLQKKLKHADITSITAGLLQSIPTHALIRMNKYEWGEKVTWQILFDRIIHIVNSASRNNTII